MKRHSICVLAVLMLNWLLYISLVSLAKEGEWTKKADMPFANACFSTSSVNGKIYTFGGLDINDVFFSKVEEYDPVADKWTKKPDMPTARDELTFSAVGGKIYAIGGRCFPNGGVVFIPTVEEYDTGFSGESVNFKGKLPTTWGDLRTALKR